MGDQLHSRIIELAVTHPAYSVDAYFFVSEAVNFTVGRLPGHRHVSARELLEGVRDFAVARYGAVASLLLKDWGIREASDIGEVVYLMIGAELLSASKEDSREDFNIDFPLFPTRTKKSSDRGKIPPIDS